MQLTINDEDINDEEYFELVSALDDRVDKLEKTIQNINGFWTAAQKRSVRRNLKLTRALLKKVVK